MRAPLVAVPARAENGAAVARQDSAAEDMRGAAAADSHSSRAPGSATAKAEDNKAQDSNWQDEAPDQTQDRAPEAARGSVRAPGQDGAAAPVQEGAPGHDTAKAQDNAQDTAKDTSPPDQQDGTAGKTQDVAAPKSPDGATAPLNAAATQGRANCPGNPDALGTSRVLAIDPADYKRIGRMQYPDTLPLNDKEVVLTFDDGPLPPYSNQILDILATQCVKATYFLVGEMARAYPAVVRRIYEEGHTIGTHSEDHPMHFGELPIDRMRRQIDLGISDVGAALGDTKYLAPFFRLPGLDRSDTVENELAARHLIVFSSDVVADDWHHGITPEQIKSLALSRLQARGKGILLLHDIHPKTVAALPGLLKALKDNGFHIVQVVPSASYQIAMARKPKTHMLASAIPGEVNLPNSADNPHVKPAWPQPAALSTDALKSDEAALPAPDAAAFQPDSGVADDSANVQWPEQPRPVASKETSAAAQAVKKHRGSSQRRKSDAHSDDHERRHGGRRHERASGEHHRHRADVLSKTLAASFMPTRYAHQ
jgi:peptidoglycan/xylan/chitin deacetylase (PgdA/CDA1 family)